MEPKKFDQKNTVIGPPPGFEETIIPLPAFVDQQVGMAVSCWKPTPEELEEINKTGEVWLTVPLPHPPVSVSGFCPIVSGDEAKKLMDEREETINKAMTTAGIKIVQQGDLPDAIDQANQEQQFTNNLKGGKNGKR